MIAGLALVVPTIFALGLRVRREPPRVEALPSEIAASEPDPSQVLSRQFQDSGSGLAVRLSVVRRGPGSADRDLVIEMLRDPQRPELLVYWAGNLDDSQDGLPADAYLLGNVVGTTPSRMRLPVEMQVDEGYLVFYSLTQGEVVEGLKLRMDDESP